MTAADVKPCAMCGETLPLEQFGVDRRMASGRRSYCRACCREDARRRYRDNLEHSRAISRAASRRRRNPERTRRMHIKTKYRLTADAYDALLASQNGRCAICRTDIPGGKGDWHVDHCHETGQVRGLLCARCNVGIGMLAHDPDRIRAAANYVEHHQETVR